MTVIDVYKLVSYFLMILHFTVIYFVEYDPLFQATLNTMKSMDFISQVKPWSVVKGTKPVEGSHLKELHLNLEP